ncbi:MAG TPA: AraC family transcriptional regulator [Longimicrobium sp.]
MEATHVGAGANGVRRLPGGIEMQAGTARGHAQRVLDGRDLLLLMDHPGARVRCRRRVDPLPPALLALGEPGEVLALDLPAPTGFRAMRMAPGLLAAAAGHRAPPAANHAKPGVVACLAAAEGLCDEADAVDGEAAACRLAERVLSSCGCTVRVPAHERMTHAVIARVRDHLRANCGRRVTLDELARLAGMCRFALVRAFTKEVGIPPHAYQTHLRVALARELIAGGRRLTDVALEVGFTDQSHMNRHFKSLVGTTPGEFARLFAARRA